MNAWLNVLTGLGGGMVVTVLGGLFFRRKTKAETADLITQAAERVLRQVEARNVRLEDDVSRLRIAVYQLAALVRTHGGDPSLIINHLDSRLNGERPQGA